MKLSEAPTFPPIRKGLRVETPKGTGKVNYARMNGKAWVAASVILDGSDNAGTVFPAEQITLLEDW